MRFTQPRARQWWWPIALLAAASLLIFGRQSVYDWWRLRSYRPPEAIVGLANDDRLTATARRLFFVNHPERLDRAAFNQRCRAGGLEKALVLGCYRSNEGIYIFGVSDSRLQGVEQVTAAHELLHAAYGRLGRTERRRLNQQLQQVLANSGNQRLSNLVADYRAAGADVDDELHSIIATEVEELPPVLEDYYRLYFNDRRQITGYFNHYQDALNQRRQAADNILRQLKQLQADLGARRLRLEADETALSARRERLEADRPRAAVNAAAFNQQVDAYNREVGSYRTGVETYNRLVAEHNRLLEQYNNLALEENQLIRALDSRQPALVP